MHTPIFPGLIYMAGLLPNFSWMSAIRCALCLQYSYLKFKKKLSTGNKKIRILGITGFVEIRWSQ